AWPLHREHEIVRRVLGPAGVAFRPLQCVERTIELDAGEHPGRILELAALRQVPGIEHPAPGRVAPAGNSDADAASHRRQPGVDAAARGSLRITATLPARRQAAIRRRGGAGTARVPATRSGD